MRITPISSVQYNTKLKSQKLSAVSPSFNGALGKFLGGTAGAVLGLATVAMVGAPAILAAPFLYAGAKWGDTKEEELNNEHNKKKNNGK